MVEFQWEKLFFIKRNGYGYSPVNFLKCPRYYYIYYCLLFTIIYSIYFLLFTIFYLASVLFEAGISDRKPRVSLEHLDSGR